jgi:DNA repair protein RecN (Recombination protein N)
LILGNRADSAALKDTERNCIIEGVFDISEYGLEDFFVKNDLEFEPSTVIRRVITPA